MDKQREQSARGSHREKIAEVAELARELECAEDIRNEGQIPGTAVAVEVRLESGLSGAGA